jgi:hypothetical protein
LPALSCLPRRSSRRTRKLHRRDRWMEKKKGKKKHNLHTFSFLNVFKLFVLCCECLARVSLVSGRMEGKKPQQSWSHFPFIVSSCNAFLFPLLSFTVVVACGGISLSAAEHAEAGCAWGTTQHFGMRNVLSIMWAHFLHYRLCCAYFSAVFFVVKRNSCTWGNFQK